MKYILTVICLVSIFNAFTQNVGIGTNTPLSKLHVAGTIRSDTLIGSGVRSLFASPNGRIYDSLVLPSTLNWEITGNSNITPLHFLGTTNSNDVVFKSNNIERARILTNGNVGIGTNVPANKLEIQAAIANTSGLRLTNLTSLSPAVGTSNKALSVDVNGDVVLIPAAAAVNAWDLLGNAGTTAGTNFLGTTDAQDLVIKTSNTEKLRVRTNGQVGIGTPAPNASAIVEIVSATQGVMLPTITSVQRLSIGSPAIGLMVYDLTANILMSYNGARWQEVGGDPIGSIEAFHKNLPATPALPWGWAECNGQILADAESPYNGQTLPSLNATGKFLRGSTVSGTMQTEDLGSHSHTGTTSVDGNHTHTNGANSAGVFYSDPLPAEHPSGFTTGTEFADAGASGVSRGAFITSVSGNHNHTFTTNVNVGAETRPTNMSVIWIIRVK